MQLLAIPPLGTARFRADISCFYNNLRTQRREDEREFQNVVNELNLIAFVGGKKKNLGKNLAVAAHPATTQRDLLLALHLALFF